MTAAITTPVPKSSSIRSASSASLKERAHEVGTLYKTAREAPTDAASIASSRATSGITVAEPLAALPQKPVSSMSATHFGEQVAALAKQTKLARNVLPMLVRGGLMAGIGMLVFGHLAPLAIVATMVGAVVGGYVIAKVLQKHQAKQFAAMGDNNPLTLLKNNMPEDASQADVDKLNSIINFVERGNVFEAGMIKSVREPYRAIKKRIATLFKPPQAPAAQEPTLADDEASTKSEMSESERYKQAYLQNQKA